MHGSRDVHEPRDAPYQEASVHCASLVVQEGVGGGVFLHNKRRCGERLGNARGQGQMARSRQGWDWDDQAGREEMILGSRASAWPCNCTEEHGAAMAYAWSSIWQDLHQTSNAT